MKRFVRGQAVVLIGVLAATVTSAAAAPATAPANAAPQSHLLQVTPVGSDSSSSGGQVAVALDPGTSAQRSFVVANRSPNLRLTVRLAAVDATAGSGGVVHYASAASISGPASWLTLSDVVATLEPNAKLQVSVTVAPPENADPGDALAGLVVRVDHAVKDADGSPVQFNASDSLPVAIKVRGAATALVSVVNVDAVKDHGGELLAIAFQNAGATPNAMTGSLRVLGSRPRTYPIRATVAPLTRTTVRIPFTMPPGVKTVPVSVEAEDAKGDQAAWSGSVGFASTPPSPSAKPKPKRHGLASLPKLATTLADRGASLPRLPLMLVIVVLAGAAMWFGAELWRSRARRRALRLVATVPRPAPAGPTIADPIASGPIVADGTVADPMVAVAAQLAALVDAINRLVGRMGEAMPLASLPGASAAAPVPQAPIPTPTAREMAAFLYAPAAPRVPEVDDQDPYDWPTEAQLDEFAARRRAAPGDLS